MLLGGLQKTTLIDYPGKIACTVFTVGCNFRCPFCHNRDLVTLKLFKQSQLKLLNEKEFFAFLKKRRGILDGVCITGGEPTIQKDLPIFIRKIKNLSYLVKLDTNGGNPSMLKALIKQKLLDYIAMDIKGDFDNYPEIIKLKVQNPKLKVAVESSKLIENIKKSIKIILKSGVDFEFRTTIVPGLHDKNNLVKLAQELKILNSQFSILNSQFHWFLQPFRPQNCLDPRFLKIKPFSDSELKEILAAVKKILPKTKLRGELLITNY